MEIRTGDVTAMAPAQLEVWEGTNDLAAGRCAGEARQRQADRRPPATVTLTGTPSTDYAPTGRYSLPPGASAPLWGLYAAPPADVTTVEVEIGGLGKVEPTPITS